MNQTDFCSLKDINKIDKSKSVTIQAITEVDVPMWSVSDILAAEHENETNIFAKHITSHAEDLPKGRSVDAL